MKNNRKIAVVFNILALLLHTDSGEIGCSSNHTIPGELPAFSVIKSLSFLEDYRGNESYRTLLSNTNFINCLSEVLKSARN